MQNGFVLVVRAKVKQQQQQQHKHLVVKERIHLSSQGHFNSFGKHHRCDANDYVVPTSQLKCTLFGMQMSCRMLELTALLPTICCFFFGNDVKPFDEKE